MTFDQILKLYRDLIQTNLDSGDTLETAQHRASELMYLKCPEFESYEGDIPWYSRDS